MDAILNSTVLVAFIGLLGTLARLWYNNRRLKDKNKRIEVENNDLITKLEDVSLGLELDIKSAQELEDIVSEIFEHTKVDRFLILSATNGTNPMKYATVLVERHQYTKHIKYSLGASKKYIGFEFDSDYRDLLTKTELDGTVRCSVDKLDEGDYKSIMQSEKIKHSNWYFLKRSKLTENRDMMFYTSMATHQEESFTAKEELLLKVAQSRLQLWLKDINERNENLAS